jgi:hypothetical protein
MQDLIGYDEIIENSMRLVILETLKKIEKTGLIGKHYFIVTFLTHFPEVSIPKHLLEKYPEEMTIAIQYQYKSLVVQDNLFKISLSFNGKYEKLVVPYKAITSFADPSMSFALKFTMNYNDLEDLLSPSADKAKLANASIEKEKSPIDLSAKIISLDAFRKNRVNNDSESD